ncbi:MAG: hydrogenase formation protein HypD [candidate division WOR-3 bacterium]|nr:hydrogenase formation protein HypD [candidate division WOR-3 bacterium]
MKITRYRENETYAKKFLNQINSTIDRNINFMEVCGTHTMVISSSGIRQSIDKRIKLLSGPGCPVCVTPQEDIDLAISLAGQKDVIIVTFGDMMRVPGSDSSLEKEKSKGRDIRIVYSALDALKIAQSERSKKVIFLGVGFETTAPTIAAAIILAKENKVNNFLVLSLFKLIPPALRKIASAPNLKIDGFILPGHVSTIIGSKPYEFLAREFAKPCVITGFETLDILQAIYLLLNQLQTLPSVEIQYRRSVKPEGNPQAQKTMNQVFKVTDSNWRGIGQIENSGLVLNSELQNFDALTFFGLKPKKAKINPACRCGDVLLGLIIPPECKQFAKACTPENAIGPCMVSSEGACAAYYKYERSLTTDKHG